MLSDLRASSAPSPSFSPLQMPEDRYNRDMQEDMKTAIDLLFKFKAGLDKLNPECTRIIERMMGQLNRGC